MFKGGFWGGTGAGFFGGSYWSTAVVTPPVEPPVTIGFAGVKYSTLIEIDFSTGTRYYSFQGVSAPNAWYKDALVSIGAIKREVPFLGGDYRVANTSIVLANVDKEFAMLKADVGFRNCTVRVLFGDLPEGLAEMQTIYTGKVTDWTMMRGKIRLTVRDATYDRFRVDLAGRLNTETFPNLPGEQEKKLYPIIYGRVSSELGTGLGALPAYLVDPAGPFRYLVARHPCKAILAVYRYGVRMASSDYTVTTGLADGYTMTFLNFATDPRDQERPDELAITVDVEGIMEGGIAPPSETTWGSSWGTSWGSSWGF